LSSGVGFCESSERLDSLKANRLPAYGLSLASQQDLLAAGAVPALVLAQHKSNDSMLTVLVPFELTTQGT
jgi:hypothetical protein